jgi:uncharacterized protein (TIGR00299 family) protein
MQPPGDETTEKGSLMVGHPHDEGARDEAKKARPVVLYLDPWTGVSGDMLLGALLDTDRAGGRLEADLRRALAALGLDESVVEVRREVERGVSCTRVRVGKEKNAPLRHLADMEHLIEDSSLSSWVRSRSLEAVRRLAAVEAQVHGCPVDDIHFHEVGAVDTLVDVVGAFVLVEALGIDRVIVGTIPVGGGTVEIAHGRMGVPAPATALLLEGYPIVGGPEMKELTTPTGALLVGGLGAEPGPLPIMEIDWVGYGAGSMSLDRGPNVLRVLIGRTGAVAGAVGTGEDIDSVVELQTNLDDVSAEVVGHTTRLLREAGALDVWTVPAHMKKDRPGVVLHALVRADAEQAAVEALVAQTGTLGVRRNEISRWRAARGTVSVEVLGGEVRVKWGRWRGRLVSMAPEYEDAAAVAAAADVPLPVVMRLATAAGWERLEPGPS